MNPGALVLKDDAARLFYAPNHVNQVHPNYIDTGVAQKSNRLAKRPGHFGINATYLEYSEREIRSPSQNLEPKTFPEHLHISGCSGEETGCINSWRQWQDAGCRQ